MNIYTPFLQLSHPFIFYSVALAQMLLDELYSNSPVSLFDVEKLKDCNVLELGYIRFV